MKALTNSKDSSESRIRIPIPAFLLCYWSNGIQEKFIKNGHALAASDNFFEDDTRQSEQLLEQ
jgi:hypothetical protein